MIKKPALRVVAALAVIAVVMATCLGSTLWGQQNDSLLKVSPKMAKVVPPSPAPMSWISDVAGVLTAPQRMVVDASIRQVQELGLGDVGVAILPSIDGLAPADVGLAIYRTWRIGRIAQIGSAQRNVGVLILIVPKELAPDKQGQCFISTGLGSQGLITDGIAGTICRQTIIPQLRNRDYEAALMAGIDALLERMRADPVFAAAAALGADKPVSADSGLLAQRLAAHAPVADDSNSMPIIVVVGLTVLLLGAILLALIRGNRAGTRSQSSPRDSWINSSNSNASDSGSMSSRNSSDSSGSDSSGSSGSSSGSSDFGGSGSSDGGGGGSSY